LERIPIPKFDGLNDNINPRVWIGKLHCFYKLSPMGNDQKTHFATLHIEGSTFDWGEMVECEMEDEVGGHLDITTLEQVITTFFHKFQAYIQEDYF
jgi:hypothetical protein